MSNAAVRVKEVFASALVCASAADRERYLSEACAGDAALRAEVEALLRAHARAAGFLEQPACAGVLPRSSQAGEREATAAECEPYEDTLHLDFLTPSSRPGSAGRLDHYEVCEVIGRGGMGAVLKAFDEKLHRVVAVKVMAPALAASPLARKRFVREARAAAAVRHDHVIDIHAVEDAGPLPYLVMECVVGVSLEERIRRSGPLQLNEVLRIGMQIAQGLAAAHAQGLVHRDIKPANILLENGVERVKITDFGLARSAADDSMTLPGLIAGTPQFMAPEQASGRPVDHRADLFSLGSVLYMMCSGRPPFTGDDPLSVLRRVCDEVPPPIRELNPAVPDWFASILERLHAKDPKDRLQSAGEVADLLAQGLAHLQQPAVAPPAAAPARVAGGRRYRWLAVVLLAIPFGFGAYRYGPPLYRSVAGMSRLEFESDDPHVKVTVKKDNQAVARVDLRSDTGVDLGAGDYDLELTDARADLRLSEARITLGSGDRKVVAVREDPSFVGEVRRWEGHQNAVRGAAFSPSEPWIASISHDRSLRLWDLESGKEFRRLAGHTAKGACLAFSPDGSRILSGGDDRSLRLWDTKTGQQVRELIGHEGFVVGVAFTAGGDQALSASYDHTVRLWDLNTGTVLRVFRGHSDAVWSVALSPDGRRVLTGSWDGTARVWDFRTGDELRRFTRHDGRVWPVAFSPDGRLAASGGNDSKIWLWEVDSGSEVRELPGHESSVVCTLAFSPDGRRLLSGGSDSYVRLWDVESGRQLECFDGHRGDVWCVAFSSDGRHALSAGGGDSVPKGDNLILLWRLPK
jgi:WD40 repeat protein